AGDIQPRHVDLEVSGREELVVHAVVLALEGGGILDVLPIEQAVFVGEVHADQVHAFGLTDPLDAAPDEIPVHRGGAHRPGKLLVPDRDATGPGGDGAVGRVVGDAGLVHPVDRDLVQALSR